SVILRLPFLNVTRAPFELGCRPDRSSSRPAFCSSSLYFAIAARIFSPGNAPASLSFVAFTIIMNRITRLLPSACGAVAGRLSPGHRFACFYRYDERDLLKSTRRLHFSVAVASEPPSRYVSVNYDSLRGIEAWN